MNEKNNVAVDINVLWQTRLLAARIIEMQRQIDALRSDINRIAESHIDDFNFMSHRVSTFWDCEKSPIGMCVFELDREGRTLNCRYCGEPDDKNLFGKRIRLNRAGKLARRIYSRAIRWSP